MLCGTRVNAGQIKSAPAAAAAASASASARALVSALRTKVSPVCVKWKEKKKKRGHSHVLWNVLALFFLSDKVSCLLMRCQQPVTREVLWGNKKGKRRRKKLRWKLCAKCHFTASTVSKKPINNNVCLQQIRVSGVPAEKRLSLVSQVEPRVTV